MDEFDRYTRRLELTNGDPWRLARLRVPKQRYAAGKRGIDWDLDIEATVKRIATSTHCAISGRPLVFEISHKDVPSIDRKNSLKGYTRSNTQIVSSCVNIAKNKLTDQEFVEMCCDVAKMNGWIQPNTPLEHYKRLVY
jgi:hypothetical protein